LPFLPASTVYSAEPRSEDRVLSTVCRFVAPCSQSWGSPGFRAPALLFGSPRTWCSAFRSLSHWRRPFEAFPSPAAVHLVTAGCLLLGKEIRVHRVDLPSRRLDRREPFRVATATVRASSTSGPFSTGESVADSVRFRTAQLDAPMGFGSTRSDACRARGADLWSTDRFTLVGSNAAGCPSPPESGEEGKILGLSGSDRPMLVRVSRAEALKIRGPAGPAR